jgi:hypothetical protein
MSAPAYRRYQCSRGTWYGARGDQKRCGAGWFRCPCGRDRRGRGFGLRCTARNQERPDQHLATNMGHQSLAIHAFLPTAANGMNRPTAAGEPSAGFPLSPRQKGPSYHHGSPGVRPAWAGRLQPVVVRPLSRPTCRSGECSTCMSLRKLLNWQLSGGAGSERRYIWMPSHKYANARLTRH